VTCLRRVTSVPEMGVNVNWTPVYGSAKAPSGEFHASAETISCHSLRWQFVLGSLPTHGFRTASAESLLTFEPLLFAGAKVSR
jgi:hypothetical protein